MTKKKLTYWGLTIAATALMIVPATLMAKGNRNSGTQVIYTGDIAKKVMGYNGTTPVNITITNGKITKIFIFGNFTI